jgi:hypothetical protein
MSLCPEEPQRGGLSDLNTATVDKKKFERKIPFFRRKRLKMDLRFWEPMLPELLFGTTTDWLTKTIGKLTIWTAERRGSIKCSVLISR